MAARAGLSVAMPSLATSTGAASLSRALAATGNRPQRVVAVRSPWWECKYPYRAFAMFAFSKAENPYVAAACCAMGIVASFISLCFCVARRRQRESYVVVVNDQGDFAATHENMGWKCDDTPGEVVMEVGRAGDIFKVRRHASQLWEHYGCQLFEDSYWLNCCLYGGFPCWDTVNVYLADPMTRQRKVEKCCCSACPAGPDYRFDCLQDARSVEAALSEAHAVSGASKNLAGAFGGASVVMVAPAPGYPMQEAPTSVYASPIQPVYVQQQQQQQQMYAPQQGFAPQMYAPQQGFAPQQQLHMAPGSYPQHSPPPGYQQRF